MTKKEKHLMTVFGTLFMFTVTAILVFFPYMRQWQFYDKAIVERQTRIQHLKRQVVNKPALENEINFMDQLMNSSDLFLRAADSATAANKLLASVKKMVENAGGEISSVNILPQQAKNSQNTVSVKVSFIVDNDGMVDVLKNLAGSKPLLNVSTARIAPILKRERNRKLDTGKARLNLVVEAYFAAGGNE